MILVDSSVWIDYFRGVATPQTDRLDGLLGVRPVAIGDIILAEVLQGFASEAAFARALDLMGSLDLVQVGGRTVAVQAAQNYRKLTARGITIRKTIDALIATRCIQDGLPLLYSDRDFDPFVAHLDLLSALGDGAGR